MAFVQCFLNFLIVDSCLMLIISFLLLHWVSFSLIFQFTEADPDINDSRLFFSNNRNSVYKTCCKRCFRFSLKWRRSAALLAFLYFLISLLISYLTRGSARSVLFDSQVFGNRPDIFFVLFSLWDRVSTQKFGGNTVQPVPALQFEN